MTAASDLRPEMSDAREEDASQTSALQLQLAAGIVNKLIERNGGSEAAHVFWGDDALDSLENENEYVDPELWDPDGDEVLPESKEIEWNIYECN